MCPENALKLLFGVFQNCLKTTLKQLVFFSRMVGVYRRSSNKIARTLIHKYESDVMWMRLFEVGATVRWVLGEFSRVAHGHRPLRN